MSTARVYDEVVEFIAAGASAREVVAFRPSQEARERVAELVSREKAGDISPEEASELGHYAQIEHLMRLAKARARQHLAPESMSRSYISADLRRLTSEASPE